MILSPVSVLMNRRVIVRVIVWVASLVVVVAAGLGAWRYRELHQPPPVTYQTTPLARRHIVGRVTATGTLLATVTVTVGTQVSGRIAKLLADYNSPVKKGQLVAKIDPLLYEAALDNARADFIQAKAQVESAKATAVLDKKLYARELALQKDNLASQQDVETSETNSNVANANVDVAKANLAQEAAQLRTAEANLMYTDIISPIDGTVISRSVDVGQTVAASLSAPTLFTIAEDLHKMQVNTNVSEGDVGRLEKGMEAIVLHRRRWPRAHLLGGQDQPDPELGLDDLQNVVTYDAVIDVVNEDLQAPAGGMTANSTVVYAERDDVLSVSNAALRFRPPPEMTAPEGSASAGERHHRARRRDGEGAGDGGAGPAEGTRAARRAEDASHGELGRSTMRCRRRSPSRPACRMEPRQGDRHSLGSGRPTCGSG